MVRLELARRRALVHNLNFDFAQQETVCATRVTRSGQAVILHHIDAELIPGAFARLERDQVRLIVRDSGRSRPPGRCRVCGQT